MDFDLTFILDLKYYSLRHKIRPKLIYSDFNLGTPFAAESCENHDNPIISAGDILSMG